MGLGDWAGDLAGGVADAAGEFVGDVRDVVVTSFGGDSRARNAAQEQAAAAKEAGRAERQDLAAENRSLQSGNGYDPTSITQHENWKSLSHRHIYDTNQRSLSEQEVNAVGTAWESVGKELVKIGDELAHEVPAATRGGWEGQAADAANRSLKPQVDWMRTSGDVFHLTGNKMKQAGSAAGQVKAMVPQPQDHDISQTAVATVLTGPFGGGTDILNQMRARQEAESNARDAMGRVYTATYADVDSTVPAYKKMDGKDAPPEQPPPANIPPPPPPVNPGGRNGGGYSGGDGGNPSPYSGGTSPSGYPYPGGGGTSESSGGSSSSGPPAGSGSAWAPNAPGPGAGAPGTGVPGGGGPGGARPGVPGAVGGYVGGVGGAGGRAGGSGAGGAGGRAGGAAGRAGGAGRGALGAGGRSGSGSFGGSGSTPSSTSASSSAGRGAGRMPMGAMRGGQGGGEGGEDEHERPSWLEEWDDVWLNDMPKTAPPVIGE